MKRLVLVVIGCSVLPAAQGLSQGALERYAEAAAVRYEVPADALKAICFRESSWNPRAVGSVGEIGLCQLRPSTVMLMKGKNWRRDLSDAERFGLIQQELYDPKKNLDWAAKYLQWMMREANGDITLAIAAYNAGPGVIHYVNRVKLTMRDYRL